MRARRSGYPTPSTNRRPKAKHAPKVENRHVKLDPFAVAAIRLLILTGARLREILHARWCDVDFERGLIQLPNSKTGAKPIYLSAAAQELLSDLPRIEGNPYIFAGKKKRETEEKDGAPRADLKQPWSAVTRAASLEGLRIHDLRHSFASLAPARPWDCRSSANCWAIHSRRLRSATRIWTLIQCVAPSRQSERRLLQR